MSEPVLTSIEPNGVATVTLNRPDVHNAFNEAMIAAIHAAFERLGADPAVRVIVLRGEGRSFCAGADLDWMKRAAGFTAEQNQADAQALSDMLNAVDACPKPVVAAVHGGVYGGGVGLACVCDIALADHSAKFALTEVRLGLTPATISPFVVRAIGAREARHLFLTAKAFGPLEAERIGLIHHAAASEGDLASQLAAEVKLLLANAPEAMADAKRLVANVAGRDITPELRTMTAERIAARRASREGREGIAAFLEKRKANWVRDA
jgi:methylglutaconyl-CoA hydratase